MALTSIYLITIRQEKSPLMAVMTGLFAVYFFADTTYYTLDVSDVTWATMDIISQFVSLWAIPLAVGCIESEWKKTWPGHLHFWRYIPGLLMGIISIVMYLKCGLSRISSFLDILKTTDNTPPLDTETDLFLYYCNNNFGNRAVFLIQTVLATIILGNLMFRKRHENSKTDRHYMIICGLLMGIFALSSARAVFGRFYMLTNQVLSSIISASISVLLIALGIVLFPTSKKDDKSKDDEGASSNDKLMTKFLSYIQEQKPYLSPDFTLEKAASDLLTNRTYLSILVNSKFGTPFRGYINNLRIEYAKEYILEHRDEKLEDVAIASGFYSGTQFSRKFKEKEGMTPNAWIRSRMKM